MNKHLLKLLVSFSLLALIFIFYSKDVSAYTGSDNGFTYETINNHSEIKITGYNDYSDVITIPAKINVQGFGELNVTYIDNNAFSSNSNIISVEGANITSIAPNAFSGCSNLKDITLPKLTEVPEGAFKGFAITDFSSSQLKTIGNNAFEGCVQLEYIELDSVESIGDSAFSGCIGLQTVKFTNAKTLGREVFKNCTELTNVTLSNVTVIGSDSFNGCTKEMVLKGSSYFIEYAKNNGVKIKEDPKPNPNPDPNPNPNPDPDPNPNPNPDPDPNPDPEVENTNATVLLNNKLADLINNASKMNGKSVIYFKDYIGNDAISIDVFNLLAENPNVVLVLDYTFFDTDTQKDIHVHAVINQAILSKIVTSDIKLFGPACLSGFVQYYNELPNDIKNHNY